MLVHVRGWACTHALFCVVGARMDDLPCAVAIAVRNTSVIAVARSVRLADSFVPRAQSAPSTYLHQPVGYQP